MSQNSTGQSVMVQGRIVWTSGDLFKGKPKLDHNTRQPKIDQKTGQPIQEYGFGIAVPKEELTEGKSGFALWSAIHTEAYQIYPSRQLPPAFAWKYKDGDGVDHNGASFAQREGYAGHLIFACTSQMPIKFFRWENGYVQVNDGIKCGDYVQVQLQVKAHGAVGQGKPGLYLNPLAVLFLGYGKEIINTPSAEQMFGNQAPSLPPGASATPLVPQGAGTQMVPTPAAQFQAPPTPGMAQPQYQPQPAYQGQPQVQPNYGVLPPQHQPPMGNGVGQNQVASSPMVPSYPSNMPGPVPSAVPPTQVAPSFPQNTVGYAPPAFPSNQQPGMPPMPAIPR
jgi:hypothetical protein